LISKLPKTNINNITIKWIENYLNGRKQRVVLRDFKLDWVDVYSGVPQGSVIGPLLFVIYINDIQDGIISKINIFAEYTKMTDRADNRFHTEVL